MRIAGALGIVFLVTVWPAAAQDKDERKAWGYVVAGPGWQSSGGSGTFHAGGGGEILILSDFAVSGEAGYVQRTRSGGGFGLASVNGAWHFGGRNSNRNLVPFITGGGSVAFAGNSASGGGNIGFGVQYWFRGRSSLRVEFRDHIFSSDSPHTYQFRIGLAFR